MRQVSRGLSLLFLFRSAYRTEFRYFLYPSRRGSIVFINRPGTDLPVLPALPGQ